MSTLEHAVRSIAAGGAVLLLTACSDASPVAPAVPVASSTAHSAHAHNGASVEVPPTSRWSAAVAHVAGFVARFLETPLGEQPMITPSLRILSPGVTGRVRANTPVTIRVQYANFDNRPELRTPNAGSTLGSQPQVLTEGRVQGHIHGYLQRLPENGQLPDVNATSFCVLERVRTRTGFDGIAEGECPAVTPGEYRLSVEFQTNSHTSILKDGPRAVATSDVIHVRVR
jgi:hypothetical protein